MVTNILILHLRQNQGDQSVNPTFSPKLLKTCNEGKWRAKERPEHWMQEESLGTGYKTHYL